MQDKFQALIKKYALRIVVKNGVEYLGGDRVLGEPKNKDDEKFVREHKADIIEFIKAEKAAKEEAEKKAYEEYKKKVDAIEGLKELQNLIDDWDTYNEALREFIENDAIGKAPVKPDKTIKEVADMYPRAKAYIAAENYHNAAHYVKATAGKKALDAIINGEDYEKAIADMKAEWSSYCEEHMWD